MSEASVSIRLNPFKKPSGGMEVLDGAAGVPWSPYGYLLSRRPVFTLDPLFHAGCYYVQDSSAMYVGHIFRKLVGNMSRGVRVLDLCAAPGGKTTDLSASLREMFGDDFTLVSNEPLKARFKILQDNVARWGDPNVRVTCADPSAFGCLGGFFDVIVADVPCSGEGMFRKDERAREQWSEELVRLCSARQKRILADVWPSLRQGGILIYSTCTYERSENDDILLWAVKELGGDILECGNEHASSGVAGTECGNLLRVGEVPGEGQWVGALRKTAPDSSGSRPLSSLVRRGENREEEMDPDECLRIGFSPGKYPFVEVDRNTALKFLHRDSLVLPQAAPGYNVLTYSGIPLGFVKNIGTRCNNLLPKWRRILMNV